MKAEQETGCLYRKVDSKTQTRKARYNRWENVENIFGVNHPERITGRHILLVDDVITTGATLEACAQALLEIPGVRVSIATIAYASF
jgi:predicted amidophosphoribosyltransferase